MHNDVSVVRRYFDRCIVHDDVTMRKSYGVRSFRITEIPLYHELGKLPKPKFTHSFY